MGVWGEAFKKCAESNNQVSDFADVLKGVGVWSRHQKCEKLESEGYGAWIWVLWDFAGDFK